MTSRAERLSALLSAVAAATWMRQAACRSVDPELFFPGRGESTREAKAACAGCPVRVECLDYAIANGERHGIWGGLSPRERRRARRQHMRIARPPVSRITTQTWTLDDRAIG